MFYDHADDLALYAVDDEFYLGDHLLVAPVTEANVEKREVYLPVGAWVNLWTKERYDGGKTVTANAPMFVKEGLPIYVKVGGGVAYQPDCLSLYDNIPEKLRVELYADESAELVLNESETVTNRFACKKVGNAFEITAENNGDIDREYTVVVYASGKTFEATFGVKAKSTATKTIA